MIGIGFASGIPWMPRRTMETHTSSDFVKVTVQPRQCFIGSCASSSYPCGSHGAFSVYAVLRRRFDHDHFFMSSAKITLVAYDDDDDDDDILILAHFP